MPAARSSTSSRRARARRGGPAPARGPAATRLLVETGDEEAVSIRAVAEAVGVTLPLDLPAPPTRPSFIFAVCEEQFRQLDAEAAAEDGAADALGAAPPRPGLCVRFGLRNAEAHWVLFMYKDHAPEGFDRETMSRSETFNHLVESVQRCLDVSSGPGDPFQISRSASGCWSTASPLLLAAPGFWPAEPAELVDRPDRRPPMWPPAPGPATPGSSGPRVVPTLVGVPA